MFQITAKQDFVVYQIGNADVSAVASFVPELGGVVSSLVLTGLDGPRECLYQHPHFWQRGLDDLGGGMPFLFPVCARLSRDGQAGVYQYQGERYQLPIHGFSWQLPWQVLEHSDGCLVMQLCSNEQTLQQFPFDFCITLKYELRGQQLFCFQTYDNQSGVPMPYYAGFHPYFLLDADKSQVELDYQPVERWLYNESLTDLVGRQAAFDLSTALDKAEINEQLTRVADDKTVCMQFPNGDCLQVEAQGIEDADLFPFIQLYTMPERPFFCVEPWMSFPNALNSVQGVRWLAPGQQEHGLLRIGLG